MKRALPLAVLALLAAMAAPAIGQVQDENAAAAEPTAPPAQGGPEVPVTPEMLIGLWSDNGDCNRGMLIRGDRSFHSFATNEGGTWRLERDVLTLNYSAGIHTLRVVSIESDRVVMVTPDGGVGDSYRCASQHGDRPTIPIA
jgi:hypothetical protein